MKRYHNLRWGGRLTRALLLFVCMFVVHGSAQTTGQPGHHQAAWRASGTAEDCRGSHSSKVSGLRPSSHDANRTELLIRFTAL